MENELICQSCAMPIDNLALQGTEKDGTKSHRYCVYCYRDGVFTDPSLTLDQMRARIQTLMNNQNASAALIAATLNRLPNLFRWKKKHHHAKKETMVTEADVPSEKVPLHEPPLPGPLVSSEEELDTIPGDEPRSIPQDELKGN